MRILLSFSNTSTVLFSYFLKSIWLCWILQIVIGFGIDSNEKHACFQSMHGVRAMVPTHLYSNFGIASSNLANTFSATSNIVLDDYNIMLDAQSVKFDLIWSAIGRACPPNVFSDNAANAQLLEQYVRTSGCLLTTFYTSHEKYSNDIPMNQKDGVVKVILFDEAFEGKLKLFDDNASSYPVVYYLLLGNIPEMKIHDQQWTVRSKFIIDKSVQHGLKYYVFENVVDLKREVTFYTGASEYKGMVNFRSEQDYKYTMHKICERSKNVDQCNSNDVHEFFGGNFQTFNNVFLASQYYRSAKLTPRQECESILSKHYYEMIQVQGDIQEHIDTLRFLGGSVNHITEFGIRSGVSTLSWFLGGANIVVGYDLKILPSLNTIKNLTQKCNRQLILNEGDTAKVNIDPTDLLFIDSLHTGEHLRKELFRHHVKVRKYILLHDVESCGKPIPDNPFAWSVYCLGGANLDHKEGLRPVIDEFLMKTHGDWVINFEKLNNNGLMMLERVGNSFHGDFQ